MPAPIRLMVFEGYRPGYGFFNSFGAAIYRPEIGYGSTGAAVTEAQKLLTDALQLSFGVDGVFGPRTLAATREYQRQKGLKVDGIIGKNTWSALLGQEVTTSPPATTMPPSPPDATPPGPGTTPGGGGGVGPDIVVGDDAKPPEGKTNWLLWGAAAAGLLLVFGRRKKQ